MVFIRQRKEFTDEEIKQYQYHIDNWYHGLNYMAYMDAQTTCTCYHQDTLQNISLNGEICTTSLSKVGKISITYLLQFTSEEQIMEVVGMLVL
jgi:hypothetical protein